MYLYYMLITDEGLQVMLPVLDSLHKKDVVVKECWLWLYDKYLEYKNVAEYQADDYNDSEGIWKDVKANFRWTRLRGDISNVDMYYDNPEQMWMVSIEFRGVGNCTGWLYEDPKEALKIYTILRDYFISRYQ